MSQRRTLVVRILPVATLAALVAAGIAPGKVVTGVEATVLLVDSALEPGHGSEATTGVVDLLPLTVRHLALEGESSDDEAILDLLLLERIGTEDLTGREGPAELVDVGALPLHTTLDVGVDEAGGGSCGHAVEQGEDTHPRSFCYNLGMTPRTRR